MSKLRFVLAVAVLGAFLSSPAAAAVAYTVTDLGQGQAYAVNNSGQAVGAISTGYGTTQAVLYNNGNVINIGAGNYSTATGINNAGLIIGQGYFNGNPQGSKAGFVYSSGNMTYLSQDNAAVGINNFGQVVTDTNGLYANGYTWQTRTSIPINASGINDAGQIIGDSEGASIYYNGTITHIPGTYFGHAYAINNAGQVVGILNSRADGKNPGFIYSDGTTTDIGSLAVGFGATPNAINNAGLVVGEALVPFYAITINRAFIYSNGTITDLNNLVDPNSGWNLQDATGINDNGQIVGYGIGPDGQQDAFLLTPTPEPATMGLLAIGLAALLARRRQSA